MPDADPAVLTQSIETPLTRAPLTRAPLTRAPFTHAPPLAPSFREAPGERCARRVLRDQIAKLERELASVFVAAFPHLTLDDAVAGCRGPRVLGLGELERTRDGLIDRLARARTALGERHELERRNRELLEQVMLEPGRYRYLRISRADLGEPGCGEWHVRPRLGLIGMLAGWWQVKLSSGCPLATGPRRCGAAPG